MDTAEEALKANEEYVTPKLLDDVQNVVTMAAEYKDVLKDLLSTDQETIDKLFDGINKFIEFERTFVASDKGETAIKAINKLKSRPLMLRVVAASLS